MGTLTRDIEAAAIAVQTARKRKSAAVEGMLANRRAKRSLAMDCALTIFEATAGTVLHEVWCCLLVA